MPSAQDICARLMEGPGSDERPSLIAAAAADEECGPLLMALSRREMGPRPGAALAAAVAAVEVASERGEQRSQASAGRLRGQALRALGRHEEAVAALSSAAETARHAGDVALSATVQIGAVDSLGMLARFDEAFALAERLESDLLAAGDAQAAARVMVNAGGLHFRRDRYDEALDCFARAGDILSGGPTASDQAAAATVWMNQANILTQRSRVEEALALYEKARAVFEEHSLTVEAAVVDLNAGFLHYVSGRHSAAVAALSRAHAAFTAAGRTQQAHQCAVDRGDVYRALNLHAEALADYDAAIAGFSALPNDYDLARAQMGRAAVLIAGRRSDEAFGPLEAADSIFHRQRNTVQRAYVGLVRAHLLSERGDIREAQQSARSAQAVLARRGLRAWAAEARFVGIPSPITTPAAVRSMRAVAEAARALGRGWLECRAEIALARYYSGRTSGARSTIALRHLRTGAAALERTRALVASEQMHVAFLRDKLAVYEDLVDLLLTRGRPADVSEALEWAERSRSRLLLERLLSALNEPAERSTSPETKANDPDGGLRARVASLRAELSRAYYPENTLDDGDPRRRFSHAAGGAGPDGTVGAATLALIENAYRDASRELDLTNQTARRGFASFSGAPCAEDLQPGLSADETLLEYYRANGRLYVFVAKRGSVEARMLKSDVDSVERAVRKLRYHIQRVAASGEYLRAHGAQLREGFDEALGRLYDLLWRPIEDLLGAEKVVVVPHGPLHAVPFHALLDRSSGRTVLETWEVVASPSAAVRCAGRYGRKDRHSLNGAKRPPGRPLLMGVPAPGLEHIAVELERLSELLPDGRVLCGGSATLEAFRRYSGSSRLLHIATHARFRDDNPLFSGLRFSDGWLLARDLYEMTLDCDLATLSACSTGLAQVEAGDEQFGLVRGFLAAGARSVAVSLWPVEDVPTARLMTRFYQKMGERMSRAAALRSAQREMLEAGSHPAHWAAFMLVGDR